MRASRIAGISLVPVIIREGEQNEQEKLELAIIENLQREDLNAVDRALAFQQLAESFELSHAQVAKKVGRSREYVSNSVRLLALPNDILDAVRSGNLSEGHARTLLMLSDKPEEQETVFREILLKKLSVREVERIARNIATDKVRKRDKNYDPDLIDLEKKFTETLGTRVQIQKTDFGGKVTIDYFAPEDLTYMLERMKEDAAAQSSERRPFSAPQESSADEQAVDELTDATPLSALIAQLQQAEEKTEGQVSTPPAPETPAQPNVSDLEPVVPPETATTNENTAPETAPSVAEPDTSDSTGDVARSDDGIRITITDAPVSLTQSGGENHVSRSREPLEPTATPAPTPAPEPASAQSGPRVVTVAREYTTAMYVASTPAEPATSPAENIVSTETTESATTEEDESDLYSIRNFSV